MNLPVLSNVSTLMDLVDWGPQPHALAGNSHSTGRLLHKGPDNRPESGVWVVTPGTWRLAIPRDEFCHFVSGRASYTRDDGETTLVFAGTCVHFSAGWTGVCTVHEVLRNVYLLSDMDANETLAPAATPVLHQPLVLADAELQNWGMLAALAEGDQSRISGRILHQSPNGQNETGIWQCTPGVWRLEVMRDEFCHFLRGRCIYTGDDGEITEIVPDTIAYFRQGWIGTCHATETVRKVYMKR